MSDQEKGGRRSDIKPEQQVAKIIEDEGVIIMPESIPPGLSDEMFDPKQFLKDVIKDMEDAIQQSQGG